MNKIAALIFITIFTFGTTADAWSEREALKKIEQELKSLNALILVAKSQTDTSSRTTFNYQFLLSGIEKVRKGISSHLEDRMEPIVPSTINALKSNYTECNP